MGYVDHTLRSYADSVKRTASVYTIDGGVDYSTDITLSDGSKAETADNFTIENGILRSRGEFVDLEGTNTFEGDVHSFKSFENFALIHAGTSVYKVEDGELDELYSQAPDNASVMVVYRGLIYIYCAPYVYSYALDGEGDFKEEFPTAPLYKTSFDCQTQSGSPVAGFKPNILAPFVAVTYSPSNYTGDHGGAYFIFPYFMDEDRNFCVYYKDEIVPENKMWADEYGFEIDRSYNTTQSNVVKICLYSTESALDKSDILKDCTSGAAYGGATLDGTKIFLSGNENFKGEYFTSELADPLCFFEGKGGIIGEGNENIKALSRQGAYLLVFTENTVYKISYGYNENTGGYFTAKTISTSVGCLSENGAALVGSRNVFASRDGVYMVCDTGNYEVQNVVPLSRNITDYSSDRGYNSLPKSGLKKSVCCAHNKKYMLLVDDRVFVLDLGYAPYANSSDSSKAEKRLCWTEFKNVRADVIFGAGGDLYIIDCSGEQNKIKIASDRQTLSSPYVLRPKELDFSLPHEKKLVERMMLEFRCPGKSGVKVRFFADGKEYYSAEREIEPGDDGISSVYLKLPGAPMKRFGCEISGNGANVGIFNFKIEYRLMKKN
ncbi:MAG: hypothetical protein J6036_02620 [Clostridia bacterium]|nr:hypothetical protein [Clostridia bacterium]